MTTLTHSATHTHAVLLSHEAAEGGGGAGGDLRLAASARCCAMGGRLRPVAQLVEPHWGHALGLCGGGFCGYHWRPHSLQVSCLITVMESIIHYLTNRENKCLGLLDESSKLIYNNLIQAVKGTSNENHHQPNRCPHSERRR